jgi:hypothetical protein
MPLAERNVAVGNSVRFSHLYEKIQRIRMKMKASLGRLMGRRLGRIQSREDNTNE